MSLQLRPLEQVPRVFLLDVVHPSVDCRDQIQELKSWMEAHPESFVVSFDASESWIDEEKILIHDFSHGFESEKRAEAHLFSYSAFYREKILAEFGLMGAFVPVSAATFGKMGRGLRPFVLGSASKIGSYRSDLLKLLVNHGGTSRFLPPTLVNNNIHFGTAGVSFYHVPSPPQKALPRFLYRVFGSRGTPLAKAIYGLCDRTVFLSKFFNLQLRVFRKIRFWIGSR